MERLTLIRQEIKHLWKQDSSPAVLNLYDITFLLFLRKFRKPDNLIAIHAVFKH